MDNFPSLEREDTGVTSKPETISAKDLTRITATLYIQNLVKFVLREHGILVSSILPDELWKNLAQIFCDDIGKIIVAYAKGPEKSTLKESADAVKSIPTHEVFKVFCSNFHSLYFSNFDYSPESVLKYFMYIVELSVLLYLKGLEDAPLVAIDAITKFLLGEEDGQFTINVRLGVLNEIAKRRLERDQSLKDAYESGEFAW